nr:MAG TPA: tail protein [Caudoviricetes sp.]
MVQTIYDKTGKAKAKIAPSESSTQMKEVQGDNILTLSFTHYANIALDVNDYTDFEGERYWLMEKYAPKQNSESEWVYDLKLYGIESIIKRFLVLETTNGNAEPVFTLTAPPRDHVKMIVKCINDGLDHTTDWKVGQVDGTDNIVIDYEGKYCDEALKEIAEKVGGKAEWWIEGQTVNICRCEHGEELTIGYGNGLTELERDTSNTAKFYTRLFPIGSTRNIDPEKYGHSRLMLPGGLQYVELHTEEYGIYDHYEQDAFSGIYPRRTGEVSSVRTETKTNDDGNPFNIYYFKDETLHFDPNEYELTNEVKRVSFQDGELAGLGTGDDHYFEVNFNSKTREFEIITIWPYDDDTQLPGGNLIPKVGDHYILWNIRMPDEYYALAEEEFRTAVDQYNAEHWQDISIYKGATDHVWVEQNKADLFVGRRVRLESEKFFPDTGYRSSRITKITRKVTLPSQMDLEISDATQSGVLEKVNDSISALKNYTRERTSGSLPGIIRSWEDTLPTDTNLFSARRSQRESLSKKNDDTARGLITFAKGLISEMLAQLKGGATFGTGGYKFDEKGNVVVDALSSLTFDEALERGFGITKNTQGKYTLSVTDLMVWGKAVFNSLEIRKLYSVGGNVNLSGASSKLQHVVPVTDADGEVTGWKCYILGDDGTMATQNGWARYDQAKCQTFDIKEGVYENVSNTYYWRLVTDVSTENETITETYTDADGKEQTRDLYDGKKFGWVILSKTDCESAANDAPKAGDTIVLDGHRMFASGDPEGRDQYNDESRTNVMMLETTGAQGVSLPRIVALTGITDYRHSDGKNEYSNTVFILSPKEVVFVSSSVKWISASGDPVTFVNFRGNWVEGTKYAYYDQVSHDNAIWTCVVEKGTTTTEEPSDTSAAWRKEISGGKGEKGDKGTDAVTYELVATPGYIKLDADGSIDRINQYSDNIYLVVNGYKTVGGKRYHQWGTEKVPITVGLLINDGAACYSCTDIGDFDNGEGTHVEFEPSIDSYSSLVGEIAHNGLWDAKAILYENDPDQFMEPDNVPSNKILATLDIPIVQDGKQGDGVVMAYKHADTQPDAPTGTVPGYPGDGWNPSPDAATAGDKVTGVSYGDYESGAYDGPSKGPDATAKEWAEAEDGGRTWMKSPSGLSVNYGYALMKVSFTTQYDNTTVDVEIKAYSEQNFDLVEVWALDTAPDTGTSFRGQGLAHASGNGVEQAYSFTVAKAGRHFICVTYAKDSSANANGDYGLFRLDLSDNEAAVSDTVWMSQAKVSGGKCVLPWSTPVKINGADGIGALEITCYPETIVIDTDDNGLATGLDNAYASLMCLRDGKEVSDVTYKKGLCMNCGATVGTDTGVVTITSVRKQSVTVDGQTVEVSCTSGSVTVNVTDPTTKTTYVKTIPFSVDVAKFNGRLKADNERLESEYTELKGDVDNKFTAYDSKLEQTSERISSAVSKVDEVGKTVSEIKQTSNGISSTVSVIRYNQIGNNYFTGVTGIGWHGGVFDGAGGFYIPYTDYAFLPPIPNFNGDYILSFGNFNENLQIEIYQTYDAYEIDKLNYYCNFNGDKEIPILLVVEGNNNDTLNNTYLVTSPNANLASLKKDDIVVVQKHVTSTKKDVYPKCKIKTIISDTTDSFQASKVEHRYLYKVTVSEIAGTDDNAKTYNSYGTVSLVCSVSTNDTVVDGTALNTVNFDNNISRSWIRFKGDGNTWLIRVKAIGTNTDIYFGSIMVEDATLMGEDIRPHRFSFESSALSSSIKQTATEIRQQVGDSYTSLKNGNFTIGANTKIQGNLNVTGTENKITVVNDDGTQITQIQPVSVGTWSGLKAQSTINMPLYKATNYSFMTDSYGHISKAQLMDTSSNKLTVIEYFDVGSFNKNDSIIFDTDYSHRLNSNGNEVASIPCTYEIYSISSTGNMSLLKTLSNQDKYTLSLTSNATIRVKTTTTITLDMYEMFTPNSFAILTYKIGFNVVVGNKEKLITTVGYDGINGSFGNGNYFMIGKDTAAFKYGNYEIELSKDGIVGINRKNVKRIGYGESGCVQDGGYWTYDCGANTIYDTFIGIGSLATKLILPSNPIDGQEITVVDKVFGSNFMVQPSGGYKTCFDGTSGSYYTRQHELPTNTTWHFIFSHDTWYAE